MVVCCPSQKAFKRFSSNLVILLVCMICRPGVILTNDRIVLKESLQLISIINDNHDGMIIK